MAYTYANVIPGPGEAPLTDPDGKILDGDIPDSIQRTTGDGSGLTGITPGQVGLGNVTNDAQVKRSEMDQPLGVPTLDASGRMLETEAPLVNGAPGNLSFSGPSAILPVNASAVVAFGYALYMASDGTLKAALNTGSSTVPAIALAIGTGVGSQRVILPGSIIQNNSWAFTPGQMVYLGSTAGSFVQVDPNTFPTGTQVQEVGIALASNKLLFIPSMEILEKA